MKLLTIVLPTSNRGIILRDSLPLLSDQIKRHKDEVELIVCDNASSDDTVHILQEMCRENPFFSIVQYQDRIEDIGESIARAANNGEGKFIHFWSDDDIPSPFMVDTIVKALHEYPDIDCIMMNRLHGWTKEGRLLPLLPIHGVEPLKTVYDGEAILYNSSEEFIYDHARDFGFLGVFVISRFAWIRGMAFYSKEHLGYQFQAPVLCGLKGSKCAYLGFPHLIQRQISPQYIASWPLYLYVGYARMCKAIESAGVVSSWRKVYDKYRFIGSHSDVLWNVTHICIPNKELYLPYVAEMIENQTSKVDKAIISLIRVPAWLLPIPKFVFWLVLSSVFSRFLRKVVRKVTHLWPAPR